jgi:arylamine N-acetyltransferase
MTDTNDAPWLRITDRSIFHRFCARHGIDSSADKNILIGAVAEAFARIPFENLTKIIKADSVISASSAMRYPDEVLGDWLRFGAGGTCFALTAATIAVYDALGIETHPILADRHYGPDTHSGLLIADAQGLLLLDPGYLVFAPTPLPLSGPVELRTGFNTIELVPANAGTRVELYTRVRGNRKLRLTFKVRPVDAVTFARAWQDSFGFEMMSYPVMTRRVAGEHHYFQGDTLAVRDAARTRRTRCTDLEIFDYLTRSAGIDRSIVGRVLEIVRNGRHTAAAAG